MRTFLNAGVILLTVIAILLSVFFALNVYIYNEKQGDAKRADLAGTIVCLPHKDPSLGTKECMAGLRTDSETHYAIEFVLVSVELPQFRTGDRLSASGMVIAGEAVPENLDKYDIAGLFSITDSIIITSK